MIRLFNKILKTEVSKATSIQIIIRLLPSYENLSFSLGNSLQIEIVFNAIRYCIELFSTKLISLMFGLEIELKFSDARIKNLNIQVLKRML